MVVHLSSYGAPHPLADMPSTLYQVLYDNRLHVTTSGMGIQLLHNLATDDWGFIRQVVPTAFHRAPKGLTPCSWIRASQARSSHFSCSSWALLLFILSHRVTSSCILKLNPTLIPPDLDVSLNKD